MPDFSEKIEKEVAILSLNFATLRCGILTVTLRARFRCLSRSKEAPVEVPSSQGCPIRQNGTFNATEQNSFLDIRGSSACWQDLNWIYVGAC